MGENGEFTYVERNIYLYDAITKENAVDIVAHINHVNTYDSMVEEQAINQFNDLYNEGVVSGEGFQGLPKREPILLEINSTGGSTSAGFSIISAIENSETPVIGYVTGDCMSMAIAILASCHYRISSTYAGFMIHDIYSIAEGKFNDLNSSMEYVKSVRNTYKKVVVENSEITEDELDEMTNANSDFYFSPERAKEFGLVDNLDGDEVDEEVLLSKLYGIEFEKEEDEEEQILLKLEENDKELEELNVMLDDESDKEEHLNEIMEDLDKNIQILNNNENKSLARKLVDKLDKLVK